VIKDLDFIEKKVLDFVKKESLIYEGDSILISISGGSDSFALSEILFSLSSVLNLRLSLLYIDHHVRKNTGEEKRIIKEYSEMRNLPFDILDISPKSFSEKDLRDERYKILEEFSERKHIDKIALGHTLNDHIETIIMNFLRGYGLDGLSGISPKREKFIRPLLVLTKEEILEYCKRKNLPYIDDFTNFLPLTLRNTVRFQLIPFLEEAIEQFPTSIITQAKVFAIEEDFLEKTTLEYKEKIVKSTDKVIEIDFKKWEETPKAIRIRLLKKLLKEMGQDITSEVSILTNARIMKKKEKSGKIIEIGDLDIYKSGEKILIYKKRGRLDYEIYLPIPGKIRLPTGEEIEANIIENKKGSFNIKDIWQVFFDYDRINIKELKIRTWREGDRIKLFGLGGKSKKLQDLFVDKKIPHWKRLEIPLVFWENELLWVVGLARSDIASITEETKKILHLKARKEV